MKRSKFSEGQVAYALRQAESGTPVGDVCRQLGVGEATFYTWKKKYAHLGVSELRRLRQLEDENARLDFASHWAMFPDTAIFLVLSINCIGDGPRDALDPRKVLEK